MTREQLVFQLTQVYFAYEDWHSFKMPQEEALKYHAKLFDDGNIIFYEENDELLGYCEFWKISFEQFGKLVCHEPFSAYLEDVKNGNIAYVANVWVRPSMRRGHVIKLLTWQFFKNCSACDYFVGEALRKGTHPIKVFKKSELKSRLFREGVM